MRRLRVASEFLGSVGGPPMTKDALLKPLDFQCLNELYCLSKNHN